MKKILFILTFIFASLVMIPANGDTITLYADGHIKSKTIKHENRYEFIKYYENGNVEEIQFYSLDKERVGTWIRYSDIGKLVSVANFKRDKKDGEWKMFDENGKMITYIHYINGKRDIVCGINENNELAVIK